MIRKLFYRFLYNTYLFCIRCNVWTWLLFKNVEPLEPLKYVRPIAKHDPCARTNITNYILFIPILAGSSREMRVESYSMMRTLWFYWWWAELSILNIFFFFAGWLLHVCAFFQSNLQWKKQPHIDKKAMVILWSSGYCCSSRMTRRQLMCPGGVQVISHLVHIDVVTLECYRAFGCTSQLNCNHEAYVCSGPFGA